MEKEPEEIIRYFTEVLEPKSSLFGGLPVCPFAKKERITNNIVFQQLCLGNIPSEEVGVLIINHFKDGNNRTLVIYDPDSKMNLVDFRNYGIVLCEKFSGEGIISIALHPQDTFSIEGFRTRRVPFPFLLVQRAKTIQEARKILERTHYYTKWSQESLDANEEQFGKFLP
jgi:hypothetical protein